jgi:hypothetical protein
MGTTQSIIPYQGKATVEVEDFTSLPMALMDSP